MTRLVCLLLLVMTCPTWAAPYYMSPTGNDSNPGTGEGVAWQHFSVAVSRLSPGDTLYLLNGTYTTEHAGTTVTSSTDVLSINCESGGNAVNGTAGAPITIKAVNDRQALLQGSGKIVVYLWSCAWWNLEGLYIRNVDVNPGSGFEGTNLVLNRSDHITVKRSLIYWPNAWFNSHGIALYNTNTSLIEDNEVYGAPRHGIIQGHDTTSNNPTGNILRRNYINGRQHGPMPGGFTCPGSCENTSTDEGISLYPGQDAIIENNIIEDATVGFSIQGEKDPFNNKYLGNITGAGAGIGTWASMGFGPRDEGGFAGTARQMPTDILMENNVVVGGTYVGCGACKRLTWKNMTMINATEGFAANSFSGGDGHTSVTATNMLTMGNSVKAYDITSQESQSFDYLRNFNNANQSFPSGATHTSTNDPNMGTCRVYIPSTSNLKGAGLDGADIGANVLYRYQDGVLTGVPLWDTGTGRFPCGVQVDGVNNIAGSSCFDVHTRLYVNDVPGCPFPTSYGGAAVLNSLIARWQLDEGTGTTVADATGLGHTGTANGGMWQAGKVGPRSVLFDGLTQRVTVASTSDLQLTTSLTLAAWIKPVSSGGGAHGRILNKHGASSNTVGYSFHLAETSLTFAINAVSGTDGMDDATTPSGTVTLGLWQHVAVTLDAGTVRFYRNGQLVSSSTLSTTALASPVPLVLGGADGRTDRGFDGSLDDLRVYNFALSGADITALYRLTAGQPRHRLVLR